MLHRARLLTTALLVSLAPAALASACGADDANPDSSIVDGAAAPDAAAANHVDAAERDAGEEVDEPDAADSGSTPSSPDATAAETRDPHKWPFAVDSIWNTPIGSAARYVSAGLVRMSSTAISVDEDIIILHPEAPPVPIYANELPSGGQWTSGQALNRCIAASPERTVLADVPIPSGYVFSPRNAEDTANAGLAALRSDGHTIVQTQPFSRCTDGGPATTGSYANADEDLFEAGTNGAHGGSGLSAIGGTLRLGELRPDSQGNVAPIRHVLKLELDKPLHLFGCTSQFPSNGICGTACNCRWPAHQGEENSEGTRNSAMRFGSLLAIPTSTDLSVLNAKLKTAPARALAWTLQNYGAYVVDDTAWEAYSFVVELGPDGSFQQQFAADWKFPIKSTDLGASDDWRDDVLTLMEALMVVDDNAPASTGGAGARLQPPAPPFAGQ